MPDHFTPHPHAFSERSWKGLIDFLNGTQGDIKEFVKVHHLDFSPRTLLSLSQRFFLNLEKFEASEREKYKRKFEELGRFFIAEMPLREHLFIESAMRKMTEETEFERECYRFLLSIGLKAPSLTQLKERSDLLIKKITTHLLADAVTPEQQKDLQELKEFIEVNGSNWGSAYCPLKQELKGDRIQLSRHIPQEETGWFEVPAWIERLAVENDADAFWIRRSIGQPLGTVMVIPATKKFHMLKIAYYVVGEHHHPTSFLPIIRAPVARLLHRLIKEIGKEEQSVPNSGFHQDEMELLNDINDHAEDVQSERSSKRKRCDVEEDELAVDEDDHIEISSDSEDGDDSMIVEE